MESSTCQLPCWVWKRAGRQPPSSECCPWQPAGWAETGPPWTSFRFWPLAAWRRLGRRLVRWRYVSPTPSAVRGRQLVTFKEDTVVSSPSERIKKRQIKSGAGRRTRWDGVIRTMALLWEELPLPSVTASPPPVWQSACVTGIYGTPYWKCHS